MFGAKHLRIRFDKIDEFIRVYDGARHLILLGDEKKYSICNKIRYLIQVKSGIKYVISYNYARIKVDLYDPLILDET